MSSHPNRSKKNPKAGRNPAPAEIIAARERAGLTQTAAAELVYSKLRTWQDWEAGIARMHPATWELFQLKAKALR